MDRLQQCEPFSRYFRLDDHALASTGGGGPTASGFLPFPARWEPEPETVIPHPEGNVWLLFQRHDDVRFFSEDRRAGPPVRPGKVIGTAADGGPVLRAKQREPVRLRLSTGDSAETSSPWAAAVIDEEVLRG